jgi:hypothetical protein
MLPRVQRVWGNEPSHSQVNSHVGSWSPERTFESSERDFRCQNSSPWKVFYIIGKLLKCRCHVGSWSLEGTLKFSERDFRGQNTSPWRVLYIIGKLLNYRCLKWVHIPHLDICNTSYGQKKGQESNWQFDSQPLKVENRPDFLSGRQHVTYCWKTLDKGYNFA